MIQLHGHRPLASSNSITCIAVKIYSDPPPFAYSVAILEPAHHEVDYHDRSLVHDRALAFVEMLQK